MIHFEITTSIHKNSKKNSNTKTMKNIRDKIFDLNLQILKEVPEIAEFLNELPVTIPNENEPNINEASLQEYYDSLLKIMTKYKIEIKVRENEI